MKNEVIITKLIGYIDKIQQYVGAANITEFRSNTMLLEACVFCLSQMGELVQRLDDDYKTAHHEIPWSKISGMRHRIVHDYDGIVIEIIWDTITTDLPTLKNQLQSTQIN